MTTSAFPAFAKGLCDDAAIFPPGLAPLAEAVPAHVRHVNSPYAELVGPLVVSAAALEELAGLVPVDGGDRLDLTVTVPDGPSAVPDVLTTVAALPVELRALEVPVPAPLGAAELVEALEKADIDDAVEVFVEIPRDERRPEIIAALPGTRYKAKFRTGGVKAELYPDEAELAAAIKAVVDARVPYKATAGLHHAIRDTDPQTGFEQHGFLNLLLATEAALNGAEEAELIRRLADRDGAAIAERVAALDPDQVTAVRAAFRSFGTCSISDPLTELVELGLLPTSCLPTYERTV
ncbi:hypothetical protein [Saccharomonospora viridis]|uniref:Uncharacterized protein n=1 Tax=Saccharomonospora viridis (strain ATCC 15386 / DSM 43017 / JCM 3036 / CCUG 5913 / NBRC 12207 / NCIMB 9602 / P101) TaxID=471857 RepID=C7MVQ3_SACVD|nr:hypothetical protein [Saccharomonospora viridis]ACU95772.1 hypothetical protein Svir_07010 [Saccharomonospora viridis DSM 43017]